MNITTRTFKKVVGTVINYFCGEKLTLVKILSKKQKIYEQSMEKEWRKIKFTSFAFNPSLDTAISSLRACSSFSDFFRNYLHHTFKFIFSHLFYISYFHNLPPPQPQSLYSLSLIHWPWAIENHHQHSIIFNIKSRRAIENHHQ